MNYYQHHIGDFIRDTARLSDAQCMAYLRMIWMYYETEAPLEDDVDAIAFRIGATAYDVRLILRHFFFLHENRWHHSRCDREVLKLREKSDKAKKSADARWNNANAMRTHTERNAIEPKIDATQYPIPSTQEKPIPPTPKSAGKPASTRAEEVFDDFWSAYPKKVGKEAARKAWAKVKHPIETCGKILLALSWQVRTEQWMKNGGQFIPNPATYLNQGRWMDERPDSSLVSEGGADAVDFFKEEARKKRESGGSQ